MFLFILNCILIPASVKFVPNGQINNNPALIQEWLGTCSAPSHYLNQCWLSLPTHLYVTWPWWVKLPLLSKMLLMVETYCYPRPGGHFTNEFSTVIHVWWKIHSALIDVVVKWLPWNFANDKTAVLSCHVQNVMMISYPTMDLHWNQISIEFEYNAKIIHDMVLRWRWIYSWFTEPTPLQVKTALVSICFVLKLCLQMSACLLTMLVTML